MKTARKKKKAKSAKVKSNSNSKKEVLSHKAKNGKQRAEPADTANRRKGEKPEKGGKAEKPEKLDKKGAPAVAVHHAGKDEKQNRLSLIRARHEGMKREIDQIREDLESDEED